MPLKAVLTLVWNRCALDGPRAGVRLFARSFFTFQSFMQFLRFFSYSTLGFVTATAATLLLSPAPVDAHGFAGPRFFPATLTTDDPFVADELSLPTLQTFHTPDRGGTREFDVSIDLAKTITPYLDIEIGQDEVNLFPRAGHAKTGLSNLELGSKFQFYVNGPHETILSLGVSVDVGGTGSRQVGRDPFSTWSPGLFFGKGFGDLPDRVSLLRPLALTGNLSVDIPTSASSRSFGDVDPTTGLRDVDVDRNAVSLETNFALQYSLIYLQDQVRNIGLKAPFDRMIPLVEAVVTTPLNRGQSGLTTASINPGVIWSGSYCQFGVEALIPVNARSGSRVGVLAQFHVYLDDLFPHVFKPLFGGPNRNSNPIPNNDSNTNSNGK